MPRANRDWHPGSILHVMNRGIHRMALYREPEDYQYFLLLMRKMNEKYGCEVLSWCLMTNHFHILLATGDVPVWRAMKFLQMNYAIYYNHQFHFTGHLFESRYVSAIADTTSYLLEASRYIHLNPVKAGMVREALAYPYSSYREFVSDGRQHADSGGQVPPGLLSKDRILSMFSEPHPEEGYRRFVEGSNVRHEREIEIQHDMYENELWLPWDDDASGDSFH